ncbi:MAG: peptidoglycan DD-metalloendopeptidase family protein [Oscillospiraceae bacterium]|nr:peptidoglycan DD-metalloendopeptidase family protein [Oscillospiraceae bacterium]
MSRYSGFDKSRFGKFLAGKGFYGVLAACLVGAGAAAWVIADKTIHSITGAEENPTPSRQSSEEPGGLPSSRAAEQKTPGIAVSPSSPSAAFVSPSSQEASSPPPEPFEQPALLPESPTPSYIMPVADTVFNPYSGSELVKDETLDKWHTHKGMDIRAALGTPVRAVADGTVTHVGDDAMWGRVVEITHEDGSLSRCCGLAAETSVIEGDIVLAGDTVGLVGDTNLAEAALEPHLHFEFLQNGVPVDSLEAMGLLRIVED